MNHCAQCKQPLPVAAQKLQARQRLAGLPIWELYHGDSLAGLAQLPTASVDAIITDPPYGAGFSDAEKLRSSKQKYVSTNAKYKHALPDMAGESILGEHWRANFQIFLQQSARVLRPGAAWLCFMDWRGLSATQSLLAASGLRPRGLIVWDKGPASRPYKGGFRMQAEFILWASSGTLRPWAGQPYLPGVFRHATMCGGKVHITQKPEALMADLVQTVPPGGLIVDPFSGSGSTGVAAIKSGRRFVGWELVDQYYETAVQRLRTAENPDAQH